MTMSPAPKLLLIVCPILVALMRLGAEPPSLPAGSVGSPGPRALEEETRISVLQDYLQAWQALGRALSENRPEVLDEYFVGIAKEKLADTIREQQKLGIQTIYDNQAHDPEVVFYSPDGLSIQLLDKVGYQLAIRDHGRAVGSQQVRARYVAVLTPTETKWKVRMLQAEPQGSVGSERGK